MSAIVISVRRPMRLILFMTSEEIRLIVDAQALDREQFDLGAGADNGPGDAARRAVLEGAGDRSRSAAKAAGDDNDGGSQEAGAG
ncbi:hypothetical protein [Bradyrhizobium sp.]|uniref:hypothetical protein n=1 Tax=Bradyrhizobium sp. TaxID=376 RepID=UPI0039E56A56